MRTLKALVVVVLAPFAFRGASATNFNAGGGSGDAGGEGGSVELHSAGGIKAGGSTKTKFPKELRTKGKATLTARDVDLNLTINVADLDVSPGDLDPDLSEVTTKRDFFVPTGTTLNIEGDVTITSTRGNIVVAGTIQDNDGADDGVSVSLRPVGRSVIVLGTIEVDGETAANGGNAGDIDLEGLNIAVGSTAAISARAARRPVRAMAATAVPWISKASSPSFKERKSGSDSPLGPDLAPQRALQAVCRPRCQGAADSNDDNRVDLNDAVWMLVLFFPNCGPDSTPGALGCLHSRCQ